jgi:hypothetical protein
MRANICVLACAALFAAFAPQLSVAKTTAWASNSSAANEWSNASNWTNGVPVDGDDVVLGNNAGPFPHSVDIPLALASLSITGNFSGLVQLERQLSTGTLLINAPVILRTFSGRLTVTGITTISGGGTLQTGSGIGGVAVDFQGDVTVGGSAGPFVSGTFSGSGTGDTLVRSNLFVMQWGNFTNAGGGTLIFNGARAQSWSGDRETFSGQEIRFGPVTIKGAGTIVTLASNVTTTALQVDADATLRLAGRNLTSTNLTLSAGGAGTNGGTLDVDTAGSTITLTGSYTIAGTAKPGRLLNVGNLGVTNLNGTGTLDDAAGIDIGNITVGSEGVITLTSTTPIIRNLIVAPPLVGLGGNINLDTNLGNLRLTGTSIMISQSGGLTATNTTSLVTFEGGAQSLTLNGAGLPAVRIGNGTATTVTANDAFVANGATTFAGNATTTLDLKATNNLLTGAVTIPANNVLSASGAGAQSITLGGNLNLSGNGAIALGTTDTLIFSRVGACSMTLGTGAVSIAGKVQVGTGATATALTLVPAAGSLSIGGLTVSSGNSSLNLGGFNGPIVTGTTTVASGGTLTNAANGTPTFQGPVTINAGGTLVNNATGNIAFNNDLVLAGTLTATSGALTVAGSTSITGGTLNATGNTLDLNGNVSASGGSLIANQLRSTGAANLNFSGLNSFNVPLLTLLGSGNNTLTPHSSGFASITSNKTNASDVVYLASGTYSVANALTVTKGVVDVLGSVSFASPFNVQGAGATLRVPASGVVVTFNGGTVASGGELNFSNAAGMSIRFNAGSTLLMSGAMTVLGGGPGARVSLTSTVNTNQWNLDKTGGGTVNVAGAFVRDSRNVAPPFILATDSDNGGNNVNWSFALPRMTVSVRGSGTGSVTSTPSGINCPGNCSAAFLSGIVQLAATPTGGSVFTGWLGACTGVGPCSAPSATTTSISATFAPPGTQATLDADLSTPATIYDAGTDGILILRDMFGYTGTALTTGAVNPAGQRTDPIAIASYLSDIRPKLDIDGNGRVEPLTDGLLLLRYLLGLTGPPLTNGAIGIGATRASPDIETHIQSLRP